MATQKRPDHLPDWATSPSSGGDIVRPDLARRQDGWNATEEPPAPWMNWWQNLAYQWVKHLQRLPLLSYATLDIGDPGGGDYKGVYCATVTKSKQALSSEYLDFYVWGAVTNIADADRSLQIFSGPTENSAFGWSAATVPGIGGGTGRSVLDIDATKPTEILAVVELDGVLQVWKSDELMSFANLTLPGSYDVGTFAEPEQVRKGARVYRASSTDRAFVFSRAEEGHFLRSTSSTVTAFTAIALYDSTTCVGLWSPTGAHDTIVYIDEDGVVVKTTDGGSNWTEVLAVGGSPATRMDLSGNADGSLLIVIRDSDVYYSNDAGDTWTEASALYQTPYTALKALPEQWSACAVEGSLGVAIQGARIFATFDYGATWEYLNTIEGDIAKAVVDSDATIKTAKLLNGRLVYTDGGREYFVSLKS